MDDTRRCIPAGTQLDPVSTGELGNLVVPGSELEQALFDLLLGYLGVKAKICIGSGAHVVIHLGREIISLRLLVVAHRADGLLRRMDMVEQGPVVVKEFRVHREGSIFIIESLTNDLLF